MTYVKVTGYLEVDDEEIDQDRRAVLTQDAYRFYIERPAASLSDLEDVKVDNDDRL